MTALSRLLLCASAGIALHSCIFVAGAAVGAGAFYALGEDSVEQYFEVPIAAAHAAAAAELRARGELTLEDPGAREGRIEARVEGREVAVFLTAVTPGTTRLIVRARKWGTVSPDLERARFLLDRIALRLND